LVGSQKQIACPLITTTTIIIIITTSIIIIITIITIEFLAISTPT